MYGPKCDKKCKCENVGLCYYGNHKAEIKCNCTNTGYHGNECTLRGEVFKATQYKYNNLISGS